MPRLIERLSPLKVKKLETPGYYCDGAGLYLQVSISGSKSWIFRYCLQGKSREMGLGPLHTVTLAEARDKARQQRQLLLEAVDPLAARRKSLQEQLLQQVKERSFDDCAKEYLASHSSTWKNLKHGQQWENTLKTYVSPHFGGVSVASVNKALILRALEPIWANKTETATRVLQRIKTVLEWAASKDYRPSIDSGLWAEIRRALPKASALLKQSRQHHAACPYREVYQALEQIKQSAASVPTLHLLEFIVLTAVRSGEGRGARWAEMDFKRQCWTIPKERMKAGREHRVPLAEAAIHLLEQQRAAQGFSAESPPPPTAFVFSSPRGLPLSENTLSKLIRAQGYEFKIHGFRSTFRDWCAEQTNFPREVCEAALAHSLQNDTEAAYFRSDLFERRRELMGAWAHFCATDPAENDNAIAFSLL